MILIFYVLMDGVVRKAGEREASAGKQHLDFIGGREFLDAIENVGSFVLS
jgi:hypothetical protein